MKPIKITDSNVGGIIDKLKGLNLIDGEDLAADVLSTPVEPGAIKLVYTFDAYAKQRALIDHFNTEIGWNGLVHKIDDSTYEVYDIVVFPQTITHATVRTDQNRYDDWCMNVPLDDYNHMRMNCHSHVNMAVSPSAQDLIDQKRLVDSLDSDDFYFVMIWNKSMQYSIRFYDLAKNQMYESNEIQVSISDDIEADIIQAAESMIEKPATSPVKTTPASAPKSHKKNKHSKYSYTEMTFGDTSSDTPEMSTTPSTTNTKSRYLWDVMDYDF